MHRIELNGTGYLEAEHGRFEACLIEETAGYSDVINGEMIAYTAGDTVIMLSGKYEDVALWAESYDISDIEVRG